MAARRKNSGLTDEDVQRLRDQLQAGRRPRVQLSGPQFAADSTGTVVRIGDPATAGTDYLTVRVKVNGVTDELAFAPPELSLRQPAGRAKRAVSPPTTARRPRSRAATAPTEAAEAVTAAPALASSQRASSPAGSEPASQSRPPAQHDPPAKGGPAARPSSPAAGASAVAASAAGSARSSRRRKAGAPPKVSFTVTSTGASWAVSASRGAKGIAKSAAIAPGAVTAIVELLDLPALAEAVAEINDSARSEAQARAEQLRAELDQLEAVLAAHRSPR